MNLLGRITQKARGGISWFLKASLTKKLVIVAIILVCAWFSRPIILGSQQQGPQYQTVQAEKGTLITSVSATGTVSSGSTAPITTNATGIVKGVYFQNGDTVLAGDTIATLTLDSSSQQSQQAAWANYLSAQNTLNAAKAKMNSLQSALFKANQAFVNDRGVDNPTDQQKADPNYIEENAEWLQAEADYNNQAGVIRQAEAALSSAWLSYQQVSSTITVPIAGTISNLSLTPGLTISASTNTSSTTNTSNSNASQTLGTITLAGGLPQALVNLSEIDITKAKIGQKATLTLDAFADKTFTGKISAINTNGSVSSGVTSYPVTITFDSSIDSLYPNMAVNATIITNVKDNIILVPSSAVQTANGQSSVQVMKNGKVMPVQVEIGEANDTQVEIVSGISEGDTIVTSQTTSRPSGTQQGASPFGGSGFGRGFGGGQTFIQRR